MITAETILRELYEIAIARREELGGVDYIYSNPESGRPSCRYVHDDQTGCIIGEWLHTRYGVSIEQLRDCDDSEDGAAEDIIPALMPNRFDDHAVLVAGRVQYRQDSGVPWVDAVRSTAAICGIDLEADE